MLITTLLITITEKLQKLSLQSLSYMGSNVCVMQKIFLKLSKTLEILSLNNSLHHPTSSPKTLIFLLINLKSFVFSLQTQNQGFSFSFVCHTIIIKIIII